jgi:hypothetical protein
METNRVVGIVVAACFPERDSNGYNIELPLAYNQTMYWLS